MAEERRVKAEDERGMRMSRVDEVAFELLSLDGLVGDRSAGLERAL
jgi:hypothetical protein